MTAASTVLDDLIQQPGFGMKVTVSISSGAATATSVSPRLARLSEQSRFFEGKYLYIPSAAATDDQVRSIASHSVSSTTTTFTFYDTSNFNETLSDTTGYILGIHPDNIYDAMNTGLEQLRVRVETPLAHGPASHDMQGSSVDSDWTESNATDTVQTTTAEVLRGAQSLVVADDGSAGGYTASAAQRIGQGKSARFFFEAKADTGTGELQVIDGDSNEQADVVFTEEQWVYGTEKVDFDSADETFTIRLVSVAASDSVDWQRVWFVRMGEYRFILPSWVATDRFKVVALARRQYMTRSADTGSSDDLYLAESYDDDLLFEDVDYQVTKRGADVNSRLLTLIGPNRDYNLGHPLIMTVEGPWSAPYGVSALLSSYSSTSLVPQDIITAKTMEILGMRNNWPDMQAEGERMLASRIVADEQEQYTKPQPEPWRGPLGGRRV